MRTKASDMHIGWASHFRLASLLVGVVMGGVNLPPHRVTAQEPNIPVTGDSLAERQRGVADRFGRLEDLLLRSSDLEASQNPSRSSLLRQAVQLSKQVQLSNALAEAAKNLDGQQYTDAIEKQKAARANLEKILKLLQSENRSERVRDQRNQVKRWIEETDRLLRMQGALRGRTEGGQDLQMSAENQKQLEAKARQIADDLQGGSQEPSADEPQSGDSESGEPQTGEPQTGEPQTGEPQSGEPQSGEPQSGEPQTGEPQTGEPQSGEPQSGEPQSGEPQSGEPQSGEPQSGEPQSGDPQSGDPQSGEPQQPEQQKTPSEKASEKLRQAQEKMREAKAELDSAEREGAIEKQREAEEELREAVAQLEQILRQLREEEIERSLASLETRVRRMLEMQTKVLTETTRLSEIGGEQQSRQIEIMASKLSLEEKKILAEGERAFLLLREEGSSAAFPEAMDQVNTDAANVIERLSSGDVGQLTLVIEQDIVSSLEEMVAALVKVQKENEDKKRQQQQQPGGGGGGGESGDQPLVDKLAELRLVQTLQTRINKRTQTMSQMLENPDDVKGQADESEILKQVRELAEREMKIHRVTIKIAEGT